MKEYKFLVMIAYERIYRGKRGEWKEPKSLWRYLLVKVTVRGLKDADIKAKAIYHIATHTKIEDWLCPMGYNGNYRFILEKIEEFPVGAKIAECEISKDKQKKKVPSKKFNKKSAKKQKPKNKHRPPK